MPQVAARTATRDEDAGRYQRHRPEQTFSIKSSRNTTRRSPLILWSRAGICPAICHAEHLVAFSCRCRGFYPRCGTRRMTESAALLVEDVLPEQPIPKALAALAGQALCQWVLSFPL
jgi:hypothetical protein